MESAPSDGADDVPIDFVPVIEGFFDEDEISWESADGTPVAFKLRSGASHESCNGMVAQLVHAKPLIADTAYVIRAKSANAPASEVRFTTGKREVMQQALAKPQVFAAFIDHVDGEDGFIGCAGEVSGCMYVAGTGTYEITVLDDAGRVTLRSLIAGNTDTVLEILEERDLGCVEVRKRDDAGRFSTHEWLCQDDFIVRPAQGQDYEDALLLCHRGEIGPTKPDASGDAGSDADETSGGGCSVGGSARVANAWLVVLAVWLAHRRRSAQRGALLSTTPRLGSARRARSDRPSRVGRRSSSPSRTASRRA